MQRIAFTMQILPGAEQRYRERHQHVWPALLADMTTAGCRNYSIYARGLDLFAYMEVDDFATFLAAMARSEANAQWQASMGKLVTLESDPLTGFPMQLEEVFHMA